MQKPKVEEPQGLGTSVTPVSGGDSEWVEKRRSLLEVTCEERLLGYLSPQESTHPTPMELSLLCLACNIFSVELLFGTITPLLP